MNYRHHFHAGNHADVLKHVALLDLLARLTAKNKPLVYLDSHAGAGIYRISPGTEAPAEWRDGVARVIAGANPPPAVARYLNAVRAFAGPGNPPGRYPGSPALAAHALRSSDRIALCETQPEVAAELRHQLADRDPRITVFQADGYHQALSALLPPPERRGLALIDPPYETQHAEFDHLVPALRDGLRRFATGVYAIWYPIKRTATLAPFHRQLAALPAKSVLTVELWVRPCDSPLRLNGSGLAVVNPPWQFDHDAATAWLPWLARHLAQDVRGAGWRCHWLRRENAARQN